MGYLTHHGFGNSELLFQAQNPKCPQRPQLYVVQQPAITLTRPYKALRERGVWATVLTSQDSQVSW